jgi:hypothetical protein
MKFGGLLLTAIAAFELGGCWMGTSLYTASDARPAIPSGVYRALEPSGSTKTYRISVLANGLTQLDDGEDKIPYGFAPLDADGRTFVAWLEIGKDRGVQDRSEPNQFFGLLVRQPSGTFVAYAPSCRDVGARIAHESGATIRAGSPAECRFPSRAALEKALRLLPRDKLRDDTHSFPLTHFRYCE